MKLKYCIILKITENLPNKSSHSVKWTQWFVNINNHSDTEKHKTVHLVLGCNYPSIYQSGISDQTKQTDGQSGQRSYYCIIFRLHPYHDSTLPLSSSKQFLWFRTWWYSILLKFALFSDKRFGKNFEYIQEICWQFILKSQKFTICTKYLGVHFWTTNFQKICYLRSLWSSNFT